MDWAGPGLPRRPHQMGRPHAGEVRDHDEHPTPLTHTYHPWGALVHGRAGLDRGRGPTCRPPAGAGRAVAPEVCPARRQRGQRPDIGSACLHAQDVRRLPRQLFNPTAITPPWAWTNSASPVRSLAAVLGTPAPAPSAAGTRCAIAISLPPAIPCSTWAPPIG